MSQSDALGIKPIPRLLVQQAVPASIGFLIMSVYGIVDTIFVGRWVGPMGIAAITVVMPITFVMASIGMAIGVGGASVISRALGAGDRDKAMQTFGNQAMLTGTLALILVVLGILFQEQILALFGGRGDIQEPAGVYFSIVLLGVPFLAWAMMANNVIRAEGQPRMAMVVLILPAIANIILDPIFIIVLDWGLAGAAWATAISYLASALYTLWYFLLSGRSEMKLDWQSLLPRWLLIREIFSIGFVTLARQSAVSLLSIVLNNALFVYGGEAAVSIFGMINRMMMFTNFPVLGLVQGFMPIAGYNYGARKIDRLEHVIKLVIIAGSLISFGIFTVIMLFTEPILSIFTTDTELIRDAVPALRLAFLATPTLTLQLIGSAYFQAIGRAIPALLLALSKQGFCLIPLLFIMPLWLGLDGIWISFPIADVITAILSGSFLLRATKRELPKLRQSIQAEEEAAAAAATEEAATV